MNENKEKKSEQKLLPTVQKALIEQKQRIVDISTSKIHEFTIGTTSDVITNTISDVASYSVLAFKNFFCCEYFCNWNEMGGYRWKSLLKTIYLLNPKAFSRHQYINPNNRNKNIFLLLKRQKYTIKIPNMNCFLRISTYEYQSWDIGKVRIRIEKDYSVNMTLTFFGKEAQKAAKIFFNTVEHLENCNEDENNTKSIKIIELYRNEKGEIDDYYSDENVSKPESLIFTNDKNKEKIFNYLDKFIYAYNFFKELGIAHKTGILLYGEPGTGKTSMAKAICAKYGLTMYLVNYANLCKEAINYIKEIDESEKPKVILLDDIDLIFNTREKNPSKEDKLKAQELLEILDGATTINNVIFIATTNDYKTLDTATVRDGRFDLKIPMDNISYEKALQMCQCMNLPLKDAEMLLKKETFPINPAYLQNQIVQYIFENLETLNLNINK